MLNIICSILVVIDVGGVNIFNQMDVEGAILKTSTDKYYVDFTKGIEKHKKEGVAIIGNDFKRLVDRKNCVKF